MVTAAAGGWFAAAVTSGPLGWPAHLLSWIYLAGAVFGYRWLRRHEAVRAARARRDEQAAWTARKAWWHVTAARLGLHGWHLTAENRPCSVTSWSSAPHRTASLPRRSSTKRT